MKHWIMQDKASGKYFVTRRPNTGLGDELTDNPNEACLYSVEWPAGYINVQSLWQPVEVLIDVKIKYTEDVV